MFDEAQALTEEIALGRPRHLWHIAQTETAGHDRKAVEALLNRRYRVYRPTMPKQRRIGRTPKLREIAVSMFPGYLFVLPRRDGWEGLRESPGIRSTNPLMRINDRFATIFDDDPVFRMIEEMERQLWKIPEKSPMFRVGQKVEVTKGPMISVVGMIAALDGDGRNRFLIDVLHGKPIRCSEQHLNPV